MPIGNPQCIACQRRATHVCVPCYHQSCFECYLKSTNDSICGTCHQAISAVREVQLPEPTVGRLDPNDHTWSTTSSPLSSPYSLRYTASANPEMENNGDEQRGRGRTTHINGFRPATDPNGVSPTPAANNTGANAGRSATYNHENATAPRYVPPPARGYQRNQPIVRPDSVSSHVTFASQVTTPSHFAFDSAGGRSARATRPSAQYTGTGRLPNGMGTTGNGMNGMGMNGMGMNGIGMTGNGMNGNGMAGNGMNGIGVNSVGTGMNGTTPNGQYSLFPTNGVQQPPMSTHNGAHGPTHGPVVNGVGGPMHGNGNNAGGPGHHQHTASSDSGVSEPEDVRLANLIRAGAAENSRDPNYSNPGPGRRYQQRPQRDVSPHNMVSTMARQRFAPAQHSLPAPGSSTHPNINGSAAPYLGASNIKPPDWYAETKNGFRPTVAQVFEALPFMQACRATVGSTAGVIHISNFPYTTSKSEIIAFLGRTAQLVSQPMGTPYFAVHIMMDRLTGKTMDCFIEVATHQEALWVVNNFRKRKGDGRSCKIGNREVTIKISSQEELMYEMFPLAKKVTWAATTPIIDTTPEYFFPGVQSVGFQGFLRDEELVHMAKHVETPQRSPFASRCLIRPYESLISTLYKYPWYAVESVMLKERRILFDVTLCSIRTLIVTLKKIDNRGHEKTEPTPAILQELIVAALTCPGFSEVQKSVIVHNVAQGGHPNYTHARGLNVRFGGTHKFAAQWPFAVLVKRPGVAEDFVEYVANLLRDASLGTATMTLADIHSLRDSATPRPAFGKIDIEYGEAKNLADAARAELNTIEKLLSFVLPGADGSSPTYGSSPRSSSMASF